MAITDKRYLDFAGLEEYDRLIKEYFGNISETNTEALQEALAQEAADRQEQDEILGALIEALSATHQTTTDDDGNTRLRTVKEEISDVVGNAPELLDTLEELAEWVRDNESVTSLVQEVRDLAKELDEKDSDMKEYVDAQDEKYFNAIQSIETADIRSLFLVAVTPEEGQTITAALENLGENEKLVLEDGEISEDIVISNDCVIDAQGAEFVGTVTVARDANVTVINATFANPVVVA